MGKTSDDILLYLLFSFSLTWHLYFNLKHLTLNICYIFWPELIVGRKCSSVYFFTYIWACLLETSTTMRKTSDDILLYLLNPSFLFDIILIKAPFPQFSIVYCLELHVGVCLCDLSNLSSYENVHVGFWS